jgi:hypothetical protein
MVLILILLYKIHPTHSYDLDLFLLRSDLDVYHTMLLFMDRSNINKLHWLIKTFLWCLHLGSYLDAILNLLSYTLLIFLLDQQSSLLLIAHNSTALWILSKNLFLADFVILTRPVVMMSQIPFYLNFIYKIEVFTIFT